MNILELTKFKKFKKLDTKFSNKGLTLITGVNNSGKTSILHALAVWENAKNLLTNYRSKASLTQDYELKSGLGIASESFVPISIPSLKYLWNNQKTNGSYDLKIKVGWTNAAEKDLFLELSFTLNGNNFAIKKETSNLEVSDKIPTIAYLPPFGGLDENESLLSQADRRRLIGKGQAGSVIRNLLLDLHNEHEKLLELKRNELFPGKEKLNKKDKEELELIQTKWKVLKNILAETFHVNLVVQPFNSDFHNYIKIDVVNLTKATSSKNTQPDKSTKRDLMIEGSGFLQWVSVFTMALDDNTDVLLLDEPDAHLHSSLQLLLLNRLESICKTNKKQILMVSHSPELIKYISHKQILQVEGQKTFYLKNEEQKVIILEGLGSKYFPLLDAIIKKKNILLVENNSDTRVLENICIALGKTWPDNLVEWVTNKKHSERKTLIIELNTKIEKETKKSIQAYSLRDLDDDNYSRTCENLVFDGRNDQKNDSANKTILRYRTWRRREIENYIIIPSAISRYIIANCKDPEVSKDVVAVNKYLNNIHGIIIPDSYKDSERRDNTKALFNNDVKSVLDGVGRHFKVKFQKEAYIKSILKNEICTDLITAVDEIIDMCEVSEV